MRLVNYIDNRFQELRLSEEEADKKRQFSLIRESEQHALHSARKIVGNLCKWAFIPIIFIKYFLVQLGLLRAPEPVLIKRLEELQKKEHDKKLAKIGMKDLGGKDKFEEPVNPLPA